LSQNSAKAVSRLAPVCRLSADPFVIGMRGGRDDLLARPALDGGPSRAHDGRRAVMARFLLLIRGGNEGSAAFTPEQAEATLRKYFAWSDQLRREGRMIAADELADGGQTVRARNGQLAVDGPYSETKEAIGGFFLIEADDASHAAEIAKGCPVLGHGGFMDIRAIVDHGRD
jgi:hypothetical protein